MSPPRLSPPHLPRSAPSSRTSPCSVSPTRLSPHSTSPSRLSPPKKDPNRGFHISTILGLDDNKQPSAVVAGQRESHETEDKAKRGAIQNGVHKDLKNMKLSEETQDTVQRKDVNMLHITNDASNIDDIKTSFAHILQGLTATITQSIDKTIDTIFKSSESKGNVSQACKY